MLPTTPRACLIYQGCSPHPREIVGVPIRPYLPSHVSLQRDASSLPVRHAPLCPSAPSFFRLWIVRRKRSCATHSINDMRRTGVARRNVAKCHSLVATLTFRRETRYIAIFFLARKRLMQIFRTRQVRASSKNRAIAREIATTAIIIPSISPPSRTVKMAISSNSAQIVASGESKRKEIWAAEQPFLVI